MLFIDANKNKNCNTYYKLPGALHTENEARPKTEVSTKDLRRWTLKWSQVMCDFYGEKKENWMIICLNIFTFFRKYFSFVVNFVKSSELETQHDIYKILLTRYWNTTNQVGDPAWNARNVKKIYFRFAVNFAKLSKLET